MDEYCETIDYLLTLLKEKLTGTDTRTKDCVQSEGNLLVKLNELKKICDRKILLNSRKAQTIP